MLNSNFAGNILAFTVIRNDIINLGKNDLRAANGVPFEGYIFLVCENYSIMRLFKLQMQEDAESDHFEPD